MLGFAPLTRNLQPYKFTAGIQRQVGDKFVSWSEDTNPNQLCGKKRIYNGKRFNLLLML
jgi:hypothetical protein